MTECIGSENVGVNGPENIDRAAMRLRRVLLFPLLWILFMVNVPDVIMGILDTKSKWVNSLGDISAIVIMGSALLYLLFAIKQEKKVLRLLIGGVVLVVISQTIRITRILGIFDGLHGTPYEYGYQLLKVLDEACSGVGMVLIAAAFLTAIVDLYAAKRWLAVQREDLSREVRRRAKVEEEIIQEKQRYKDLIKNLPVAVYRNTPGPEGHFLEVNPAHVAMIEADSEEELLKINVSDLYRTASERRKIADKLMREGSVKNEEVQLVTLKGHPITGSVTAVLKYDSSGQPYFDGIIEDITARVEA
ncbi:MAG TPA: PAS domain S-box protein, partial [Candidatus Hydrogenedentes bacterium]|nr:PAS domain S-box protein [Candidatus Hydrogenedentota bacterium]